MDYIKPLKKRINRILVNNIKNKKILNFLYTISIAKCEKCKIRKFKKISLDSYIDNEEIEKIVVEEKKKRPVFIPKYFNCETESRIELFESEAIYYCVLNDVFVYGSTPFVVKNNLIVSNLFKNKRIDLRCGPIRSDENNKLTVLISKNRKRTIDEAINLCGFASCNYYHFTIETLSKLLYLNKKYAKIPILIDESIKKVPQLVEMLSIHNKTHPVIYVREYELINVKKLMLISSNTWMPINIYPDDRLTPADFLISESALTNISGTIGKIEENKKIDKFYISRSNTSNSRIVNESEIEKIFAKRGFKIIRLEEYDYFSQVSLFRNAEYIVGATGAAFTNLIYCKKGTIVGNFLPKEYEFYLYSSIAYLVGCKMMFFDPIIFEKNDYPSLDKYYVDVNRCEKYIDELLSL